MTDNAKASRVTTTIAAMTAVLLGCLTVLVASDLNPGIRYGLGAVVAAAGVFCAFRLGAARRANR